MRILSSLCETHWDVLCDCGFGFIHRADHEVLKCPKCKEQKPVSEVIGQEAVDASRAVYDELASVDAVGCPEGEVSVA
jgi:hypothetical protein